MEIKAIKPYDIEDDLRSEMLGVGTDLNSFVRCISSARQAMYGSHISQNLIVEGATPNTIMTGAEPEYAKGTFMAKMPVTGMIIKAIPRFKASAGLVNIGHGMNPETVVIYEDMSARERGHYRLGMITLKSFHSVHPTFGFKYAHTAAQAELFPGNIIPEGTIFTHSPAVDTVGHYAYGVEANVVALSIPEIIEDGFVVSESFCEKLATWEIGSRQIRWGNKEFPLNLHGTDERYKIIPDIGESVGPTGLLAGLRGRDELYAVCDMTPEALRTPDSSYDRLIFIPPNSVITDIRIYRDDNPEQRTPSTMVEQMVVYENMQTTFYQEIANIYRYHKSKSGGALTLTPELDRLVVEAMLEERSNAKGHHITKTYRAAPLEEWMIEVHYARKFIPGIRNKITDQFGGKGINSFLKTKSA